MALCRLQEGSIWVSKCWCSCDDMCFLVWGVCWPVGHPLAVMKGLAYVCNMCPVVRAAR